MWRLILDFVRNVNTVILQALPSFWKVAKGYMEGKYQKVRPCRPYSTCASSVGELGLTRPTFAILQKSLAGNSTQRRSPAHVRSMTHDIVALYVSLLSQFFASQTPAALAQDAADPNATPPMPEWVPSSSNATTNSHWLIRVLSEIVDCGAELGALELSGEATQCLKDIIVYARGCFEMAICSGWIRGGRP